MVVPTSKDIHVFIVAFAILCRLILELLAFCGITILCTHAAVHEDLGNNLYDCLLSHNAKFATMYNTL